MSELVPGHNSTVRGEHCYLCVKIKDLYVITFAHTLHKWLNCYLILSEFLQPFYHLMHLQASSHNRFLCCCFNPFPYIDYQLVNDILPIVSHISVYQSI